MVSDAGRSHDTCRPRAVAGSATFETPTGLVVFSPQGTSVHLNRTAALLWPFFDGQASVAELADDVADVFDVAPDQAVDDVSAVVTDLAARGLLEAPSPVAAGAVPSGAAGAVPPGPRRGAGGWWLRPAPCGTCGAELGERRWVATVALAVGRYHLGVRCDSAAVADALSQLLAPQVVDDPDVPPDFSLVHTPPAGRTPPRVDLYRDHHHLWRSPSSASVAQVLAGQLARYAGTAGLWWVHAVAAVGDRGGQLLPPALGAALGFAGPRLRAAGVSVVAAPVAVDPVAGVVVAEPVGIGVDPEGRRRFAQLSDWADPGAQPSSGRHRLLGWSLTGPAPRADQDGEADQARPEDVVVGMVGAIANLDELSMPDVVARAAVLAGRVDPAVLAGRVDPAVLAGRVDPAVLAGRVDPAVPPAEGDLVDWLVRRVGR